MLWIKRVTSRPLPQPSSPRSDRELVVGLSQSDPTALGALYDRYRRLVFTLVCHTQPDSAEAILEDVFAQLWRLGRNQSMSAPIMPLLLDLAARKVAPTPAPLPLYGTPPQQVPLLEPFAHFEPFIRSVLILVRLGGLNVAEVAIALEVEPATVRSAIGAGLRELRQGDNRSELANGSLRGQRTES